MWGVLDPSPAHLNSTFIAVNADGTLKWSYTTGWDMTSPAIGADGTVYVGSDKVYAFGP